jgi:hypothetical protein
MTNRTDFQELEILRVSLARIAQACGPAVELEIPGAKGRMGLEFTELSRLARVYERGWNRLAACIVDHVENPSLDDLDAKLAEFP